MFFNDFDNNGTPEQILCRYNSGMLLPYTLRGDLVDISRFLKKKYLRYDDYANQKMTDIFTPDQMKNAIELKAACLSNGMLLSQKDGRYTFVSLPNEAQFAPIFGIVVRDLDGDGHLDAVTGGNFLGAEPEFGYEDADYGLILKGDGKGDFQPLRSKNSGLRIDGEVRDLKILTIAGAPALLVARNNATPQIFRLMLTNKKK